MMSYLYRVWISYSIILADCIIINLEASLHDKIAINYLPDPAPLSQLLHLHPQRNRLSPSHIPNWHNPTWIQRPQNWHLLLDAQALHLQWYQPRILYGGDRGGAHRQRGRKVQESWLANRLQTKRRARTKVCCFGEQWVRAERQKLNELDNCGAIGRPAGQLPVFSQLPAWLILQALRVGPIRPHLFLHHCHHCFLNVQPSLVLQRIRHQHHQDIHHRLQSRRHPCLNLGLLLP